MAKMETMIETVSWKPVLPSSLPVVKGLGSATIVQFPLLRTRNGSRQKGNVHCAVKEEKSRTPMPQRSERTQYNDSWLERKSIQFLTNRLEHLLGKTTELEGYDGFVDMTRKMVQGLPASLQRNRVHDLLHMVLPDWLLFTFRLVPKTTRVQEFYAVFTMIFFRWLVGESEIRESEVNGEMIKSTVHIKKCRYLESSQCVGLCVNLCKFPTQEFIGKQFGMPLTMNPNFEDMSCDMIYGLQPPPMEEDDAYKKPCYSLCKTAKERPNCA